MTIAQISLNARRTARAAVGAHRSCPVVVVAGDRAPRLVGEGYYWTWSPNPNGARVWSNKGRASHRCYYWPSTRRVEVGQAWLVAQQPEVATDARIDG